MEDSRIYKSYEAFIKGEDVSYEGIKVNEKAYNHATHTNDGRHLGYHSAGSYVNEVYTDVEDFVEDFIDACTEDCII